MSAPRSQSIRTAVILHGRPDKEEYYDAARPSESNAHWLPWLQRQLALHDIVAQTPEVPQPYIPIYSLWQKEFERYDITPQTMLVGHSCGGGFIVRWLSEHPNVRVGRVVLVAPSLGIGWDQNGFFDFAIDPQLAGRTAGLTMFGSDDDFARIQQSMQKLRQTIANINYRQFHNYGHFCYEDMGSVEFPELLEELLS